MSIEVEALEQFFAAINRNDINAATKDFDPRIVRVEPEGFPTAGTYRGIAEVQEHIRAGRGTWAEGRCEPENFLINGDKVVEYEWGSDDWKARVAKSKFKDWPDYGRRKTGGIDLQDHGNEVWYRNIKIRVIK